MEYFASLEDLYEYQNLDIWTSSFMQWIVLLRREQHWSSHVCIPAKEPSTQITEEVRDQLLEASAATRKAFTTFRREADPDDHYPSGEGAQATADKTKDDLEMSAVITIMQPILRFLQLLCENHNRDLQVSLGPGSYSSSELPAASDVSAPLPATSILELRAQNGSDIWATEVFVSLSSTHHLLRDRNQISCSPVQVPTSYIFKRGYVPLCACMW